MKILNSNSKNFDKNLDSLLLQRKKKVQSNSVSVSSIIKDVRKNGDKALVKQPSLLILDEASSALDAETERRIQENLIASGKDRATIAVAHRLSTIRNADEILSMVDGAVVERGKHDDLVTAGGVYASQWTIQTGDMAV